MDDTLPRDVARCSGTRCSTRDRCLRYLAGQRDDGPATWFVPLRTGEQCQHMIPVQPEVARG